MHLLSSSFVHGQRIPAEFAFGAIDAATHVRLAGNRNPDFAWSDLPPETLSLAIVCHDPDVPSRGDDVNQEGRIVPASLPRVDFFHWLLIDLPADTAPIARGEFSDGVACIFNRPPSDKASTPSPPARRKSRRESRPPVPGLSRPADRDAGPERICPSRRRRYQRTLFDVFL